MSQDDLSGDAQRLQHARRRLFDDLAANAVSDDSVEELQAARLAWLRDLREMRPDDVEVALSKRLSELEEELAGVEEGSGAAGSGVLRRVFSIGEELRWLLLSYDVIDDGYTGDALALIEAELDWVDRWAAQLRKLDAGLAEDAANLERRVCETRGAILENRTQRFLDEEALAPPESPLGQALTYWFAATESFQVEIAAAELGVRKQITSDDFERVSEHTPELGVGPVRVREQRAEYLKRCRDALADVPAEDAARFVSNASSDLVEYPIMLTSIAGTSSRRRIFFLQALRRILVDFFFVIAGWKKNVASAADLPKDERKKAKRDLRRLNRLRRQTEVREYEEVVRFRLDRRFGAHNVRRFESFLLLAIFGFIGLFWIEWSLPEGDPRLLAVYWADLALCMVFQIDFFVRWRYAGWRLWYFYRRFFFESLPALPYGLLFYYLTDVGGAYEEIHFVVVLRVFRVPAALRLGRPLLLLIIRSVRIFMFFVRGMDRVVEKFRGVLDRDVVLFASDPLLEAAESPLQHRLLTTLERYREVSQKLQGELPWRDRAAPIAEHLRWLTIEGMMTVDYHLPYRREMLGAAKVVRMEEIISRFLNCDVARAVSFLGREGAQRMARWISYLDIPLCRRFPIVRRIVPAARMADPSKVVAAAANALGQVLQEILEACRFWGDLSGITTGPQILDRVGSAMVMAAKRPAIRLLLIGGFFLLAKAAVDFFGVTALERTAGTLWRVLGQPLSILGSIALVILFFGLWFKRIAGEALDAYLRTADAHFYGLVKRWKEARHADDLRHVATSVFGNESNVRGVDAAAMERWIEFLAEPVFTPGGARGSDDPAWKEFKDDRRIVAQLYRDFLDGPILHRDDNKTSVQLLGNLVLRDLRLDVLGLSKKELRRLEHLDLAKRRLLAFGPNFWFSFITESLAIETAKLVMEYNCVCIPTDELEHATLQERKRLEEFLKERTGRWEDVYRRRVRRRDVLSNVTVRTNAFDAVSFLAPSDERDAEIRERFGDEVLQALRRDRRGVVRDIFGARPYHLLPRSQRVFNPYRIYRRYLGGAKFLLMPFVMTAGFLKLVGLGLRHIFQLVREVRGGERMLRSLTEREAGFDVAVRKINRMRKPFFIEALRLRALVDIEYLGLRIPGVGAGTVPPAYQHDLDFIGALESERRPIAEIRAQYQHDLRSFHTYCHERGWLTRGVDSLMEALDSTGGLQPHRGEVMRALVTAFVTDSGGIKSGLTAESTISEFLESAVEDQKRTMLGRLGRWVSWVFLAWLPRKRRTRRLLAEYFEKSPTGKNLPKASRQRALRAAFEAGPELVTALEHCVKWNASENGGAGDDPVLAVFQRTAHDHPRWTRRIITVRALQTLTVLDISGYRDLIWKVGEYEKDPGELEKSSGVLSRALIGEVKEKGRSGERAIRRAGDPAMD